MNPLKWIVEKMPGQISCEQFDEHLDDYIDGELSPWGRVRMAAHRFICDACALYAAGYAKAVGLVKSSLKEENVPAADETVPEDVIQDILAHGPEQRAR